MPHSALVFRDIPPESNADAEATIIALHGANGHLDDLTPLARSIGSRFRVVAPEARRGNYTSRDLVDYSWYGGWRLDHPEPASFGDSLAQLERFIHDVRDRAGEKEPLTLWLLGYDQGAVLALALATVAPDLISGVMSVRGALPIFPEPDPLDPAECPELPILLIGDPGDERLPVASIDSTVKRLTCLGARVTTEWIDDAAALGPPVSESLRAWLRAVGTPRGR